MVIIALAAIIAALYSISKLQKIRRFLTQLLQEGRITPQEMISLESSRRQRPPFQQMPPVQGMQPPPVGRPVNEMNRTGSMQPPPQPMNGQPGSAVPTPPPGMTPPPIGVPVSGQMQGVPPVMPASPPNVQGQGNASPNQTQPQGNTPPQGFQMYGFGQQEFPQYGMPQYKPPVQPQKPVQLPRPVQPQKPIKQREPMNSSAVMLFTGAVLISIAGLIFATAVWSSMTGGGRTGTVIAAALFFFILSFFSLKKLKLSESSNTFYSLGSVFTVIAYATAGYYGLLGDDLTFEGKKVCTFFALAAFILSALAALGFKIYKKKYLSVTSICIFGAGYGLLAVDISDYKISGFALMMSLLFTVSILIAVRFKDKAPAYILDSIKLVAAVSLVVSLPLVLLGRYAKWGAADTATAVIYLVLLSYYAFIGKSKHAHYFHGAYTAFILSSIVTQICRNTGADKNYYYAAVFFCLLALSLVYRFIPKLRSRVSDGTFAVFLAVCAINGADIDTPPLILALMFLCTAGYALILALDTKEYAKRYGYIMPIPIIAAFSCASEVFNETARDIFLTACAPALAMAAAVIKLSYKNDKKNLSNIYTPLITAGCIMTCLYIFMYMEKPAALYAVLISSHALTLIAAILVKSRVISILPSAGAALSLMNMTAALVGTDDGFDVLAASLITFILFSILSLVMFRKSIIKPISDRQFMFDPFIFGAGFAVFRAADQAFVFSAEETLIARLLPLAASLEIFALLFILIRKGNKREFNSGASCFSAVAAFFSAVFLVRLTASFVNDAHGFAELIGSVCVFVLFTILSRLFFSDGCIKKLPHTDHADVFSAAAIGAAAALYMVLDNYSEFNSFYYLRLTAWVEFTAAAFLLIRVHNHKSLNTVAGIALCVCADGIGYSVISAVSGIFGTGSGLPEVITAAALTLICIAGSKLFFRDTLIRTNDLGQMIDPFVSAGVVIPFMLFGYSELLDLDNPKVLIFAGLLISGAMLLSFIRKNNGDKVNTGLRLASALAFMLAFIERPFLVADEQMYEFKVTITAIVVFGFAAKYILRADKTLADNFATAVHVLALILLVGDALTNLSLINTLIVLTTAVLIMIVSFVIKRKRWFLISAVTLVGLTVYITKDFLMNISWWVYLLVVGVMLIIIAVTNEYTKNKKSEKEKKKLFEEWKW